MDFKKSPKKTFASKKEDIVSAPKKAPTKPSGSKSLKEKFETIEHLKNTLRKASEEEMKTYAKLANVPYKGSKIETKAEIEKIWKNS
tara:strand:+ start:2792 stop:3052 length:261 start_codon:yes stop_codon:yes gene_type:complete